MPSEEIIDGLRMAMAKGESLMQAMMSFYNAGYSKQDVEAAARMLSQQPGFSQAQTQQRQSPTNVNQNVQKQPSALQPQSKGQFQGEEKQRVSSYGQSPQQEDKSQPKKLTPQIQNPAQMQATPGRAGKPKQRVSKYAKNKHSSMITVVLIIILILLIAVLVSLFLFKDVVSDFLGGLLTRTLFGFL